MKPTNSTKLKKLQVKRENLRLLTSEDLSQVNGAARTNDWCSTNSDDKCGYACRIL